jgi:hypothetical protein
VNDSRVFVSVEEFKFRALSFRAKLFCVSRTHANFATIARKNEQCFELALHAGYEEHALCSHGHSVHE